MTRRCCAAPIAMIAMTAAPVGCGNSSSGSNSDRAVIDRALETEPVSFIPPPWNSGCGRYQPGFCAGCGPEGEDLLDGEPYDVLRDPFCSVEWVYEFSKEGDRYFRTDTVYVIDMGEPDSTLAESFTEHMDHMWPDARAGAFYYWVKFEVEPRPFEDYSEADVQIATHTCVDVSWYGSVEYQPTGWRIGEQYEQLYFRSTDEDVVLLLDGPLVAEQPNPGVQFQGYYGLPDTGGWPGGAEPGGNHFFYRPCSNREEMPEGEGPGYCLDEGFCRIMSASRERRQCTFADAAVLPANPELVAPSWRSAHPDFYDAVFEE